MQKTDTIFVSAFFCQFDLLIDFIFGIANFLIDMSLKKYKTQKINLCLSKFNCMIKCALALKFYFANID